MPDRALESVNPATEEVIEKFDFFDDQTLEQKVSLAESTFKEYKHSSFAFRAECLKKVGDMLEKRAEDYGKTLTKEMGKPYKQGVSESKKCAKWCRWYAENAEKLLHEESVGMSAANKVGKKVSIVYAPMGTLLQIAPFNFPFLQVIRFASAALMAGNVCLVRHSHNCTLSAKHLEDMFKEAGFAEGCFQILLIKREQVTKLIEDPRIKGVTITGSTKAGRAVAKQCGENLKKHVMELGGSDAYIICEDADLDVAAKECSKGRIVNNGQSCTAAKRYIVVEKVYDEFCNKVVQHFKNFKVGDPFKEDTDIGPLARKDLRDTVHDAVKKGEKQGAKILCGGEIPSGRGFFYPATVLADVTPENSVFDEEIFGPVACIIKARDENHAIELANKSVYGLGGGIWTKDVSKGEKLIRELDAGLLFLNGIVTSSPEYPFGGVKQSGYGRECGEAGIKEWVTYKSVVTK